MRRAPAPLYRTIRGQGSPPGEAVEIRFHTEVLPPAKTDAQGGFSVAAVIPGTFDPFAPFQVQIIATTKPTIGHASTPFRLTPA